MSRRGRRGMPASAAGVRAPSDRRYRRPDVPLARRRRRAQWLRRAGRIGIPIVLVVAAMGWLGSALAGSTWLEVRGLQVRGNVWLSTGEVEALMDGIRGQHILRVDLDHFRRRLRDSPWVAQVTLYRTLPSTIEVHIVERTPLAIARLDQQLYLVDEAGIVIDAFGPEYREFDLPIVDGLMSVPEAGRPLVHPDRIRLTSRFLRALSARPDLGRRVSQIDVTNARDLVALLDVDPVLLHLGREDFIGRIETYLQFAPTLRDEFTDIEYVDLRFDEFVYVGSAGRRARARTSASQVEGRDGT